MRKQYAGMLLGSAIALLSCFGSMASLAGGPGNNRDDNNYRRGGPGVDYDYGNSPSAVRNYGNSPSAPRYYGNGPSAVHDYGGPSAPQGNAQASWDRLVRSYPGFNTHVPDSSAYEFDPGYWSNWNGPGQDDWEDEDDWWYDSGGPGAQYGQGWRYSPGGWWFQLYGGSWLSNGWQLIHSRWYLFDQNGCMVTGWYKDKDGSRFYLNPVDDGTLGMMRTGWQVIDGKSYYFNTQSDGFMGKLYVDATTPDGYKVGADGALVQ